MFQVGTKGVSIVKSGDLVEFIACPFTEVIAAGCIKSVDVNYNSCMVSLTDEAGRTYDLWVPIPHITKFVRFC